MRPLGVSKSFMRKRLAKNENLANLSAEGATGLSVEVVPVLGARPRSGAPKYLKATDKWTGRVRSPSSGRALQVIDLLQLPAFGDTG